MLFSLFAYSQGIKRAEYFIDADPGVGNGTPLTISVPADSVNLNVNIPIGALTPGFHILNVRVFGNTVIRKSNIAYNVSATGVPTITGISTLSGLSWSTYEPRSFYVQPTILLTSTLGLSTAEYFFDDDPGVGNGTPLPNFVSADSININNNISVGGLSTGFHILNIRVKDRRGIWSTYEARSFYVQPPVAVTSALGIAAAEYFFDNDPGVGNGISLAAFTVSDSIDLSRDISIGNILPGFHILVLRVKDKRGIWSTYEARSFYVQPAISINTSTGVVLSEYFIDKDPGFGKGIPVYTGIVDSTSLINADIILPNTLTSGFHDLFFRTKDSKGIWGFVGGKNFYVESNVIPQPDPINYAEYFFNKPDPGNGNATPITLGTFADSINVTTDLSVASLSIGRDTVSVRVRTKSGKYSMASSATFTICNNAPNARFKTDTVCVGTPTTFTNLTTGANGATSFAWNFTNGSGTNSTFSGAAFTRVYPAGVSTARLIVSNGGPCTTTFLGSVVVVPAVPAQSSGIIGNISVCRGLQRYFIPPVQDVKYTWSWNNPPLGNYKLSSRKDTLYANWTATGTNYAIQVTPSNVCGNGTPSSLSISINNTAVNASAGLDRNICQGDSVVLNATGGESFFWLYENVTTSGIKVKPNTTTPYIARVTQGNCIAFDTVVVVVNQIPAQAIITQSGDTIKVQKVNGASYEWYLGNFLVGTNSSSFVPSYIGSYRVKILKGNCATPLSAPFDYVKAGCATQTINFPSIPIKNVGDQPFALGATASSGLPITYTIISGSAVLFNGNFVSITGIGIVSISAFQAGNDTFCGVSLNQNFQVLQPSNSKQNQTISFNTLSNVYIDNPPILLIANSTSGLKVKYTLISGPATLSGDTLKLTSVSGFVVVKAIQEGDANYNAATDVVQVFTVFNYNQIPTPQPQTITFKPLANRFVDSPPFILTGASTSGLKVQFVVLSGPAFIIDDVVSTTGKGKVTIKAYEPGNEFFLPADSVLQTFSVLDVGCNFLPASPIITANNPICSGDKLVVKSSFVPDGVYLWKGPNGFEAEGQNFTISGISEADAGSYEVTVSVGNCKSVPTYLNVDVRITPLPPTLIVQNAEVCQNNAIISVPNIYEAYTWFMGSYTIANSDTNRYSPGIKGSYFVKVFDETRTCSATSNTYIYNNLGSNIAPKISANSDETILQSTNAINYKWYLDKRLMVGANSQNIKVLYNGNYRVHATYADSCTLVSQSYILNKSNLKDIARSSALYTDSTILWVDINQTLLQIIPNPAESFFKVIYHSTNTERVVCKIIASNGTEILTSTLNYNGLEHSADFTTEKWNSGIYIVKVIDQETVKWAKVVIQ